MNDFSRQSFLGTRAEDILANTRATIVGLGGGGSHIAQQLAHIGVGEIRLLDPDKIEASNLNRLVGATDLDVKNKRPKVEIAKRMIAGVRPWIKVPTAEKKWQEADYLVMRWRMSGESAVWGARCAAVGVGAAAQVIMLSVIGRWVYGRDLVSDILRLCGVLVVMLAGVTAVALALAGR